jgi:hypothetical protein
VRRRRRAVAVSLGVAAMATALAAPASNGTEPHPPQRPEPSPTDGTATAREPAADPLVAAPVRIADPATARLLKPGDRVDVLASAADGDSTDGARIVARRARVAEVPETGDTEAVGSAGEGALRLLSVPRSTAVQLADAAAHSRVTVALW